MRAKATLAGLLTLPILLAASHACRAGGGEEVAIPAAEARIRTVGSPLDGGWNLWSNGSLGDWFRTERDGTISVTVRAAGQRAQGAWPQAVVRVGSGFAQEFQVDSAEYRDYRFQAPVQAGLFNVEVAFVNDYVGGGEDRNLLVRELRVGGAQRARELPTVKELTEEGIRENRMGTLVIETRPGAPVRVTQLRHEFGFGTALASHMFTDRVDAATRGRYLEIARENFNGAVFENALKWPQSEPEQGRPNWTIVDAILEFCEGNDFLVRGHCLFWANGDRIPAWARDLDNDGLRQAVDARIDGVCTRYQGRIHEYDVNNEMIDHHYFEERLGASIRVHMFERAHQVDPQAVLYLNDYNILNGASLGRYEEQIRWFLQQGAPVGGIGCQGHFGERIPPALSLLNVLNRLAEFGLPIEITEFDINSADEAAKAEQLDAFYRVCFSHPAVDGIWMWGFWEGAHWRPNAALWKRDFSPTPAAEAYRNLVFKEWWTEWEGRADADGRCEAPVFFGSHRVEADGETAQVDLSRREGRKTISLGGN